MTHQDSASAAMAADAKEELRPAPGLPDGDYAIVEILGHRTLIGRLTEVERFGTKLLSIEPLYQGKLLGPVMIGGASIYQLTPCTAEVAARRAPMKEWQLPASVLATVAPAALPAPAADEDEDQDDPEFAPDFLTRDSEDTDSWVRARGAEDEL